MSTKNQILTVFVASALTAVLILAAVFVGSQIGSNKTPEPAADPTEAAADPEPVADPDSILVSGFEKMRLKAGTYSQDCDLLYNSASNTCAIVFTLYMPDGSIFYKSEPVKPGERVENMEIDQLLKAGTYEGCKMTYDCYDLKTDTTLNGADVTFTLEVI